MIYTCENYCHVTGIKNKKKTPKGRKSNQGKLINFQICRVMFSTNKISQLLTHQHKGYHLIRLMKLVTHFLMKNLSTIYNTHTIRIKAKNTNQLLVKCSFFITFNY